MVVKKVTVKFDSCNECPIARYTGCSVSMCSGEYLSADGNSIPDGCPIDNSVMMYRYTDFSSRTSGSPSVRFGDEE